MVIHIYAVLVPLLLLMAGFFAASEASLFALTRIQLEGLRESRPSAYQRIKSLIQQPDVLLATLVVGNEVLNVLIGTFVATLVAMRFQGLSPTWLVLISVVVSSSLLLVCSEILPKSLAFRWPVLAASILVYPMSLAQWLLTPVRRILMAVSRALLNLFGIRSAPEASSLSEKDILMLVEEGAESGSLEREEKEMIYNVFQLSDMTVSSVMTPWNKVFCLPDTLTPEEIVAQVRKRGFSRVPVVSSDKKEVIGVLYAKELLKVLLARPASRSQILEEAVFPPYIVSTHKKVAHLFREFKLKKVHFALVVDEYGNHLGVATLEDVLSALFRSKRSSREAKA